MSQYIRVNGIGNLHRYLVQGQKNIRAGVEKAIWNTAQKATRPIKRRIPVAFGELRDSVQAYPRGRNGHPVTSVDAPHAGAVEIGSPPHKPNFDRLLAWVKLRGLQGRTKTGLRKRFPKAFGPTTPFHARNIAGMIKNLEVRGKQSVGRHLPVDAAIQVTKAISKSIELHGTRPHWYVRESLPEIKEILVAEMVAAKAKVKG